MKNSSCLLVILKELRSSDCTSDLAADNDVSLESILLCKTILTNTELQGKRCPPDADVLGNRVNIRSLQHTFRLHCLSNETLNLHSFGDNKFPNSGEISDGVSQTTLVTEAVQNVLKEHDDNQNSTFPVNPVNYGVKNGMRLKRRKFSDASWGLKSDTSLPNSFSNSRSCVRRQPFNDFDVDEEVFPFKCNVCTASFRTKHGLSRHDHVHRYGEQRPFQCPVCPHQANRRDNLRSHCILLHGFDIRSVPTRELRNPFYSEPAHPSNESTKNLTPAEKNESSVNFLEPVVQIKQDADNLRFPSNQFDHEHQEIVSKAQSSMEDTLLSPFDLSASFNCNNGTIPSLSHFLSAPIPDVSYTTPLVNLPKSLETCTDNNARLSNGSLDIDTRFFSENVVVKKESVDNDNIENTLDDFSNDLGAETHNVEIAEKQPNFSENKPRRHYCNYCKFSTKEPALLSRHLLFKHRNEEKQSKKFKIRLYCQLCDYVSNSRTRYNEHLDNRHTNDVGHYCCTKCNYASIHKANLFRHLNTHMKQPRVERCPYCPYYTCVGNLNRHLLKHYKVSEKQKDLQVQFKSYEESNLEDSSCKQSNNSVHDFVHSRGRGLKKVSELSCSKCTSFKTFNPQKLRDHINSHEGKNMYKCDVCKYNTYYQESYDKHMTLYHNQRH